MKSKSKKIIEIICKENVIFEIPSYQRKYKWDFKKQIKTLIEDIDLFITDEKRDTFFFGTIVTKDNNEKDEKYENLILVDGQQRITSILLIFRAIYSVIIDDEPNCFIIEKLKPIFELSDRMFILQRINDFNIVKKIFSLKENNIEKIEIEKNSNYYIIFKKLKKYFSEKIKENPLYIETFFEEGISKLEVSHIILGEKEDEFLVFESINSKGEPLSSADLIKNHIMMS